MPPPLDLTGRTFGKLTVLARGPRVKFGREQQGWLCRCECGTELVVPQGRLPHRPSIPPRQVVDACLACRGASCLTCGANVPLPGTGHGRRKTCSPECRRARVRSVHRKSYKKRAAADPDFARKRTERYRARAANGGRTSRSRTPSAARGSRY